MSISIGNPGGVAQGLSYPVAMSSQFGAVFTQDKPSDKSLARSEEGLAFVTVGVDNEGKLVYISIELEDVDLARFIGRVRSWVTWIYDYVDLDFKNSFAKAHDYQGLGR